MTEPSDLPDIAPQVRIRTVDRGYLRMRRMPAADVMALFDDLCDSEIEVLSLDLDNGRSLCHMRRDAVVRVDVDWQLGPWSRFCAWLAVLLDRL